MSINDVQRCHSQSIDTSQEVWKTTRKNASVFLFWAVNRSTCPFSHRPFFRSKSCTSTAEFKTKKHVHISEHSRRIINGRMRIPTHADYFNYTLFFGIFLFLTPRTVPALQSYLYEKRKKKKKMKEVTSRDKLVYAFASIFCVHNQWRKTCKPNYYEWKYIPADIARCTFSMAAGMLF